MIPQYYQPPGSPLTYYIPDLSYVSLRNTCNHWKSQILRSENRWARTSNPSGHVTDTEQGFQVLERVNHYRPVLVLKWREPEECARYFVVIAWLVPSKRRTTLTDVNEPAPGNGSEATILIHYSNGVFTGNSTSPTGLISLIVYSTLLRAKTPIRPSNQSLPSIELGAD